RWRSTLQVTSLQVPMVEFFALKTTAKIGVTAVAGCYLRAVMCGHLRSIRKDSPLPELLVAAYFAPCSRQCEVLFRRDRAERPGRARLRSHYKPERPNKKSVIGRCRWPDGTMRRA